jgi:hypothetical protein
MERAGELPAEPPQIEPVELLAAEERPRAAD